MEQPESFDFTRLETNPRSVANPSLQSPTENVNAMAGVSWETVNGSM